MSRIGGLPSSLMPWCTTSIESAERCVSRHYLGISLHRALKHSALSWYFNCNLKVSSLVKDLDSSYYYEPFLFVQASCVSTMEFCVFEEEITPGLW